MKRTRGNHLAAYKAKVALAALKGTSKNRGHGTRPDLNFLPEPP
jgi:hypothetical protein